MKNMTVRIVLLTWLFMSVIIAQNVVGTYKDVIFLPQGFVIESLSSKGVNNYQYSVFNIASGNPAGLLNFDKVSLGFSLQSDSKIDDAWLADTGHRRISNDLPQSMGIVIPFKSFNIAYGFSQIYNTELLFPGMKIRTTNYPEGTGEYFTINDKTYVISNSIILSKRFQFGNYGINAGFRTSRFTLSYYQNIMEMVQSFNDNAFGWAVGFGLDNKKYKVGLYFENGAEFRKVVTYTNPNLLLDSTFISIGNFDKFTVVGNFPNNFNINLLYEYSQNVQVLGSIKYIYWNAVNENYSNKVEISGNIVRQVSKNIIVSAGLFETNGTQNQNISKISNISLRAIYLIGGLTYQTKFIDIDLAIADSHLLSGGARKQTIGKIGFGFHL